MLRSSAACGSRTKSLYGVGYLLRCQARPNHSGGPRWREVSRFPLAPRALKSELSDNIFAARPTAAVCSQRDYSRHSNDVHQREEKYCQQLSVEVLSILP